MTLSVALVSQLFGIRTICSMPEIILYVGGFLLPDKNAAAQRVVANAAAFCSMGHKVLFVNRSEACREEGWTQYFGFPCYECPMQSTLRRLTSIETLKKLAVGESITSVIAYNYPAIALKRLITFCRKCKIKCFADVTEWYKPKGNLLYILMKKLDTEYRMRYLHFKMDGIIAISDYLWQYYQRSVKAVKIPPLVDLAQDKWQNVWKIAKDGEQKTTFVYCGSPSEQKECLKQIVSAVESVANVHSVRLLIIGVTRSQYEIMYGVTYQGRCTEFSGRLQHEESLRLVSQSNWAIIIRNNTKVVRAGFPTKLCESITCGTPVIVNDFSNIREYIDDKSAILCRPETIAASLERACAMRLVPDRRRFDYHGYIDMFRSLLN